jgi:hypothetical protein
MFKKIDCEERGEVESQVEITHYALVFVAFSGTDGSPLPALRSVEIERTFDLKLQQRTITFFQFPDKANTIHTPPLQPFRPATSPSQPHPVVPILHQPLHQFHAP